MHNINKMIFTGEVPWHGLGTQLPRNATYEEIAELAGFYKAEERRLLIEGTNDTAPDRKALVRGDDGRYLSIVGDTYKVIDFSEVARTMVEAAGMYGGFFTTAGTLGPTGIRGWLLGELPGEIIVRGDPSPIKKFFLGSAGHDGLTPIVLSNCATRVVCQNTLGTALSERGGARFKILHTSNAATRLEQAAAAMKRLLTSYDRFGALGSSNTPELPSLADCWSALTAFSVRSPKTPSGFGRRKPSVRRSSCSSKMAVPGINLYPTILG